MNIAHYISNWWKEALEYKERVLKDGGTTKREDNVQRYYQMCKEQGILNSIKFAWLGEAGGKFRTSGTNQFWTKAYSLVTSNDATQTTSTSQPYIAGNIAPTERIGMKNPNGGSTYMAHPTISFAANDEWSVTTVVNWNGSETASGSYVYGSSNSALRFNDGSNKRIDIVNELSVSQSFPTSYSSVNIIGKYAIISIVAKGNGKISCYVNGVFLNEINLTSTFTLTNILRGRNIYFENVVSTHIIRAQALTPTQVAAEANFLRTLYPEIPSVTIGTQTWATSNCEMVATPMGNLIQNVTENVNVELVPGGDMERGLVLQKVDESGSVSTLTLNTTSPISGTQDARLVITTGNSSRPLLRPTNFGSITSVIGKYYKLSFAYKVNSGSPIIQGYFNGSILVPLNQTLSGSGTFSVVFPAAGTSSLGTFYMGNAVCDMQIDSYSLQRFGWSGSTDLYNAIYDATSGTDEQKTYAAVKAAAMWRYTSNDVALGAIYNKKYNKYALKLMSMDIGYYNTANPTALWGYRVPTRAELTTLSAQGGNACKKDGTIYWNTANGTNSNGFTALGGGYIAADGTTTNLKSSDYFGCSDADFAREIKDADNTFNEVAITTHGVSLRLIKD